MLEKDNKDQIISFLRSRLEEIKAVSDEGYDDCNDTYSDAFYLKKDFEKISMLAEKTLNDTIW